MSLCWEVCRKSEDWNLSMETIDVFDDLLAQEDHEFQAWLVDQNLGDMEKSIWCFHYWLRNNTELSPSTCVDYRKDVASNWELRNQDTSELSVKSQERSALNKFQSFQESDFMEAFA